MTTELMVDAQNALGECMLWCGLSQTLLRTDILGRFALASAEGRLLLGLESRLAWSMLPAAR